MESVVLANDKCKRAMARRFVGALEGQMRGKTIAVLGLTFKLSTDDMRDAPSIAMIQAPQDAGAVVHAYDPERTEQVRQVLENVVYASSAFACLDGADAACTVTEWDKFRALDLSDLASRLNSRVLVDLRNIFRPE